MALMFQRSSNYSFLYIDTPYSAVMNSMRINTCHSCHIPEFNRIGDIVLTARIVEEKVN